MFESSAEMKSQINVRISGLDVRGGSVEEDTLQSRLSLMMNNVCQSGNSFHTRQIKGCICQVLI